MKSRIFATLLLLSMVLNAVFIVQASQSQPPSNAMPHLERMLSESAQLIMYDFNEELLVRLDQSLHLVAISAYELKETHSQADALWRQSLALQDMFYEEVESEALIKRVRGEIRQEMSLIIHEAIEMREIDEIEAKIRDLLVKETTFLD